MNILLAEDSRSTAALIMAHLHQLGHKVTLVMDGRAAIEMYQANPPDMVLMDVVMPEVDGIEATRQIKKLSDERWIPLIIMTGLSSSTELIRGLEAGADDYLIKPVDFDVLSARINAMHRIAIMHDSLYGILENVFNGIITINRQGMVSAFNKAAEDIFGYKAGEVKGRNVNMLMPQPYRDEHDGYLRNYTSDGKARVIGIGRRVSGRRKNGEVFPMELAVSELQCEKGNLFIGVVKDVTKEEAARAEMERLALHDPLTGLPNRAHFNRVLDQLLENADTQTSALFFIDLDGFKPINDQLGHDAGDKALCTVAYRLGQCLDATCFIGRLAGDEFVVLLPQVTSDEAAIAVGNTMVQAISQPMVLPNAEAPRVLGASIGLAFMPRDGRTQTEILTAADEAMYVAKRAGKNRVVSTAQRDA